MSVSTRLRSVSSRRWSRSVHRTSNHLLWSISHLAIGVLALVLTIAAVSAGDGVAALCSVALLVLAALAGMLAELRRVATTDALTGLSNRGHFFTSLEAQTARAKRRRAPLSLAILDVDRFKAINDALGHPAGDAVLRAVAARLTKAARPGDLVARIGGEEFAVLMAGTTREEARVRCEHLRHAIAAQEVVLSCGTRVRVTVSAGVVLMAGEGSADTLVSIADAALYRAKGGGRNQVRLAA